MDFKNAPQDLMIFQMNLNFGDIKLYVINNDKLGEPVDIDKPMQIIDCDGKGYAWFTPYSQWNTYQDFPVKGIKKADSFDNKLELFVDYPFNIDLENK